MADLGDFGPSYPGVAELTRQLDQEKIAMLSGRVDELRTQNEELKTKIFKSEKDTHEFVAYFQREMESKDGIISKLNDELMRKEPEFRVQVKHLQEKTQRELNDMASQARASEKQYTSHIKMIEGELAALERFREAKDSHEKAMEDVVSKLGQREADHEQEMTDLERKFLTEKGTLQKDLERVVADVRRQAKIEAQNSLSGETKRIIVENKCMGKELRFQLQITAELQAHTKRLEEELTSLKREMAILKEKDAEYARQGQAKTKEVKRLNAEVMLLKKSLEDEVKRSKQEEERTKAEVAKQISDQTLDASGLRQLLVLKNKELRNLRKLSSFILSQRNEVESFFLEALAEVKERILADRRTRYRRAVAQYNLREREATKMRTKFPRIRDLRALDPDPPSALPTDPSAKVDLKDLTLEDKERVLRLLFAKINNVQGHVRCPPEHPLEAGVGMGTLQARATVEGRSLKQETFVTQPHRRSLAGSVSSGFQNVSRGADDGITNAMAMTMPGVSAPPPPAVGAVGQGPEQWIM